MFQTEQIILALINARPLGVRFLFSGLLRFYKGQQTPERSVKLWITA